MRELLTWGATLVFYGFGLGVLQVPNPKRVVAAKVFFVFGALWGIGVTSMWAISTPRNLAFRLVFEFLLIGLIGAGTIELFRFANYTEPIPKKDSPIPEEVAKILKSAERRAALRFKEITVEGDLNSSQITLGIVMVNEGERQVLPYPIVKISIAYTVEPLGPWGEDDFFSGKRTLWNGQKRTYANAIDPKGQEIIEYKVTTIGYDEIADKPVFLRAGGYLYLITESEFRDEYGTLKSESCWVYAPSQGFKGKKCPSHNY
jgi:hypothetical protein